MISKTNKALVIAKDKGYTVTKLGQLLNPQGLIIEPIRQPSGYLSFSIRVGGVGFKPSIHRFVAYLKFGVKLFEEGIKVRHLDGNQTNNSWENIEIGSHSENMMDIPKEIRSQKRGKVNFRSEKEIAQILEALNNGTPIKQVSRELNVPTSTIRSILKRRV